MIDEPQECRTAFRCSLINACVTKNFKEYFTDLLLEDASCIIGREFGVSIQNFLCPVSMGRKRRCFGQLFTVKHCFFKMNDLLGKSCGKYCTASCFRGPEDNRAEAVCILYNCAGRHGDTSCRCTVLLAVSL